MSGPGKGEDDRDAAASFFGDDADWLDDDSDVVDADEAARIAADHAASKDEVTASKVVAPPPPPPYVAPTEASEPTSPGFLDSILPRTLEPPRLATAAPPLEGGPEVVEGIGVEVRRQGFALPEGVEAWREALAVLELEAREEGATPDLAVQSAYVRLRHLRDAEGAVQRLDDALAQGATADAAWHALRTDATAGTPAHLDAWRARAEASEGAAAADAWRRVAALAPDDAARLEALQAALAADPTDLVALEACVDLARTTGDGELLRTLLSDLRDAVDPSALPAIETERAAALAAVGETDEADSVLASVLEMAPDHGPAVLAWLAQAPADAAAWTARATWWEALAERHPTDAAAAWWLAGRAHAEAGDAEAAGVAHAKAVDAGARFADLERVATWIGGDDVAGFAASTEALLGDRTDLLALSRWYLLAVVAERAGEAAAGVAALEKAAAGGFGPAADLLERALLAADDLDGVIALHEKRLAAWDVPKTADVVAFAEVVESKDPASARALELYQQAAAKDDLEGLRGQRRVARRLGDEAALTAAVEQLADKELDPDLRAARCFEAGRLRFDAGEPAEAAAWFAKAAEGAAGPSLAAEWAAEAHLAAGDRAAAAEVLRGQAERLEGDAAAVWWLGVARVCGVDDLEGGTGALDALLALRPGDPVATRWLWRLAGTSRPELLRARLESEGTEASRAALAVLAVVDEAPVPEGTPPAVAGWLGDLVAAAEGGAAWTERLAAGGDVDRLAAWAALAVADSPAEVAARIEASEVTPAVLISRTAEQVGRLDLAVAFAEGTALPVDEMGRLKVAAASDAAEALGAVAGRLDDDASAAELATLARIAAAAGDETTRRAAHAAVAERTAAAPERAAHAALAAAMAAAAGDAEAAVAAWRVALEVRPSSHVAFLGLCNALVQLGDADALGEAFDTYRPDDLRSRAEALSALGVGRRVAAWEKAAAGGALLDRLVHEQALAADGKWSELYDAWTVRKADTHSEAERDRLERKRRWVLAEKLASTERAHELYTQLHDEDPEDVEVLEALARVSGARGDVSGAVDTLKKLIADAPTPRDAARFQRRIAEVHASQGDDTSARQAYYDALDHDPEDLEALAGLRDVAERTEDWETLYATLKREIGLANARRRADLHRQMADVAETKLEDDARAEEAWRAVLADAPADRVALERLLALADRGDDHEAFLEVGGTLARIVTGADRAALLGRLGDRCETLGRVDDAIEHYEDALGGATPDAEAAARLAELHRARNDQAGVVRALLASADAADGEAAVPFLLEAARVEIDLRHDRDAGHAIYERVLGLAPEEPTALRFEASWLYEAERFDDALVLHERLAPAMVDEDVDDVDTRLEVTSFWFRFASMLRRADRLDDARERFEQVLALNPTHLPTLEAIGPLYIASEAWSKAYETYQQMLQLTGGQGEPEAVADTYAMLGLVDLREGRIDKAYKRFQKSLETFPNYVPALKGLAEVHAARKDWHALLTTYNGVIYNAIGHDDVIEAYLTKARVLDEELDVPDKAVQHYERSLAFEPNQPVAYLRLVEMALRRELWDDGLRFARRGLDHAAADPAVARDLYLGLATAHARLDEVDQAQQAVGRALEVGEGLDPVIGDAPLDDLDAIATGLRERLP